MIITYWNHCHFLTPQRYILRKFLEKHANTFPVLKQHSTQSLFLISTHMQQKYLYYQARYYPNALFHTMKSL